MKRYFVVLVAVVALLASAMPASAETAFNEMSKCIKTWGKGCSGTGTSAGTSTAAVTRAKPKTSKDAIGNITPTGTDNSGKTLLGQ